MHSHDEQRPDPRAQAVQRIVADLLGESEAAERAQIAADLAADPSLAAERARLEATIGLVRDSMTADARPETLAPEAAARLQRAAERNTPVLAGPRSTGRAWYATPVFRAAAGLTLALGAFALWRGAQGSLGLPLDVLTADAAGAEAQRTDQNPFIYNIWGESEAEKRAQDELALREAPPSEPEPVMDAIDPSGPTEAQDLDAGLVRELTALGYGGGAQDEAKLGSRFQTEQLGADRVRLVERQANSGPGTPGRFGGMRRLTKNADTAPAASPAQSSPTPTVAKRSATTGADEFFLGRGELKEEASSDDADARYRLEMLRGLGYLDESEIDHATSDHIAPLSPADRAGNLELLLADCRRRPNEAPGDMFYRWWGDNPFEYARTDSLSTFSVDVDTASYTLARRYLVDGVLPTKQQIRTEEFVNYFKGDVPAPSEDTFAVATDLAPSPFNRSGDAWTLRVALRGREVSREERRPLALTFVVDVSGSMQQQNRLELVKHSLRLLVGELDARDSISLVAFSNEARLVLPLTSARQRGLIESAIHPLAPQGGTNVQAGLRMGYEAALAGLDAEAHNRVVLLSDGVGNIGETDAQALNREVEAARKRGVWLNTVGVGMGNHNDAFLEQLADKGNGLCNYVDDEREARRALVENFTGAFEPIAKDVKIQVEFDPRQVERYRLLGYENRAIADADFRNDAVDAGEVGAGHQVVALYEVVRTGDGDGPLATVRVRWKPVAASLSSAMLQQVANAPDALPARELAWTVDGGSAAGSFAAASPGLRRSVLVAQLAEVLRRSIHARDDSLETLLAESRKLAPELADPEFDEFVAMVERTIELAARDWGRYDDLARRLDQLRMQHYLKARLEEVAQDLDRARLDELDGQIRQLEDEIRRELEQEAPRIRGLGYTDDR